MSSVAASAINITETLMDKLWQKKDTFHVFIPKTLGYKWCLASRLWMPRYIISGRTYGNVTLCNIFRVVFQP